MNLKLLEEYYDSPEYVAKLRSKIEVLKTLENDEYLRARQVLDVYSIDPIRFIEDFLLIKVNKLPGSPTKPFFLFKYQKDILIKLVELDMGNQEAELLIDKPREMGITWLMVAYYLWRFLFTPNFSSFILSRSSKEVDNGTRMCDDSIFGKFRWLLDRLPPYMIPTGYQKKVARGTPTDAELKLINPTMSSTITGSSTNSDAGRSRRYSSTWIDEVFSIDRFQEVYRALQSVSKVKVFTSTVAPGRIYKDFKTAREAENNYISLTWEDHPFKDKEWYESIKKRAELMNDPELMREVMPSYAINPQSAYYPTINTATVENREYNPRYPLYLSIDIGGRHDLTVIVYWQYDGRNFICLDAYHNNNRPIDWYAPFMNPQVSYDETKYTEYQLKFIQNKVHKMKKPIAWFGELDHFKHAHPTNTSSAQVLAKYSIRLIKNNYAVRHSPRHKAMEMIMSRLVFNADTDGAMRVYDALSQSRYAGSAYSVNEQIKPAHDGETGDFRAAAENFAANVPRILRVQRDDSSHDTRSVDFHSAIVKSLKI